MKWQAVTAVALALAAGVAGYAITGMPGEPSAPAPKRVINQDLTPEAEEASKHLLENFGDVRAWLTLSDALIRAERTETAVVALQSGLKAIPGNADLWVQLGVALVSHAKGQVVPAARLAFNRASLLAPDHPAPGYFLGLAWLQAGDVDRAFATWEALRERSPADAPWLPMLEERIELAKKIQGMVASVRPPAEGAEAPSSAPPSSAP